MVFGWGKKKEEPPPSTQKMEVSVTEIPKIVDGILDARFSQMLSQIKSLRDATSPMIKELSKIGQTLEKDNLDVDEIDKHLRIIVVRGKKQVIDIIKKDASELPKISNFDDVIELNNVLTQLLKKIGDVLGRQTRVIHIFAKKYAEQLKEILAQMNSNLSEIQQLIKNYEDTKNIHAQILESLQILSKNEHELNHHKQRILELTNDTKFVENKIDSLRNSMSKITSSSDYSEYVTLKQNLEKIRSEKLQLRNQISSQFTKISRPLSRYEYISSDKEQRKFLAQLLEDPTDVLISANKDTVIIILENVRKGIQSGSISVKDVEKSMAQITETEEMLDSFIQQVDGYQHKLDNVKHQMNQFDNTSLKKLEQDLEKAIIEKEECAQKITDFESEMTNINSDTPKLLSELESNLRRFSNVQYVIVNHLN